MTGLPPKHRVNYDVFAQAPFCSGLSDSRRKPPASRNARLSHVKRANFQTYLLEREREREREREKERERQTEKRERERERERERKKETERESIKRERGSLTS